MSDVLNTIIQAAMQPMMDNLYEEPPVDEEEALEREVVDVASKTEFPGREPSTEDDGYEDPYGKGRKRSAEAEMQDRLLTIPLRPKGAKWGSLWVVHTNFIEQIALLNITKSEQRALLRQWSDIQVLSEGDGNEDIVESEQDEFMLKIVSFKSRSDNPEKGVRERTAHLTQRTIADQQITMPKGETQKSGFLNTILGRNKNV